MTASVIFPTVKSSRMYCLAKRAERNLRARITPIADIFITDVSKLARLNKTGELFSGKISIIDGPFEEISSFRNGQKVTTLIRRTTGEKLWALGKKLKVFSSVLPEEHMAYNRFCERKQDLLSGLVR